MRDRSLTLMTMLGGVLVTAALGVVSGVATIAARRPSFENLLQQEGFPADFGTGFRSALLVGAVIGLVMGVSIGLAASIIFSLRFAAWPTYVIAAGYCWIFKKMPAPWKLMAVLVECHRLGILRTTGPTYQFRHDEVLEVLGGGQMA
jgi:hypothetical protein